MLATAGADEDDVRTNEFRLLRRTGSTFGRKPKMGWKGAFE
jgi:hypothetical protein